MKTAGLPPDWNRVHSPKTLGGSDISWSLLKAAIAWRVISRYFKAMKLGKVRYSTNLKYMGGSEKNFSSQMMADQMADQILALDPEFSDKRSKRLEEENN